MATTAKTGGGKSAPAKSSKSATTALSEARQKRLTEEVGIEASTEEDARAKLTELLSANDIMVNPDDKLDDLIDMASAFPVTEEEAEPAPKPVKKSGKTKHEPEEEDSEEAGEEEEVETEEEVATPTPKKAAGKGKKKEAPVDDDEATEEELVEEVKSKGLNTGTTKKKTAAPKKKSSNRARKLQGRHWETLTDDEKNKAIKSIRALLPAKQYNIVFLDRSFTVKFIGKTAEHNIFKYHLLRLLDDGKLEGIFVTHHFKTPDEFTPYLPEDISGMTLKKGDACSYIHPFHVDQLLELLKSTDFLKDSLTSVLKKDKKMADNRGKLEQQIGMKKEEDTTEQTEEEEEEPAPPAASNKKSATKTVGTVVASGGKGVTTAKKVTVTTAKKEAAAATPPAKAATKKK